MHYTFTVPLEAEEEVGNAVAEDVADADGLPHCQGMVEMSVVMRPTSKPPRCRCRSDWLKIAAALLSLGLAVAFVIRAAVEPRSDGAAAWRPSANQAPEPGDPACVDSGTAWGPGGTPGGGVWKNSKGQGCGTARCGHIEDEAWGLSADAACCKCGGGTRKPSVDPQHICTDVSYSAMEEACTAQEAGPAVIGPYSCNSRCNALLHNILTYCMMPAERWPASAAFAEVLDSNNSMTNVAALANHSKTLTLEVIEMARIRHNTSRHDGSPTIVTDAEAPSGCPEGSQCFQLSELDEVYVVFDTSNLAMAPFDILGAAVKMSAFVRDQDEANAETTAYEDSNVELSKCTVEPIDQLAALARDAKGVTHANSLPVMSHYCSPVCAEASVFGPTAFDTSYFDEKNNGVMGLRITSDSSVPLNYADIQLQVTVVLKNRPSHPHQAAQRSPRQEMRVVNAYLAAACLMHDSLDGSSNLAVSRVVRGEELVPGTGCPGAWAGMSASQLRSLEQTHCEGLSEIAGKPVSWPACCEGGAADTCTEPPPTSSADELCGACPAYIQSPPDGLDRWFDNRPKISTFNCYEVTDYSDPCQLALNDMREHCSKALAFAGNAHRAGTHVQNSESWQCFASIARAMEVAPACAGQDGRKGTVGMAFPPMEQLATALGVFTNGGVLVAMRRMLNDSTTSSNTPLSCWQNIDVLIKGDRSPKSSPQGWA